MESIEIKVDVQLSYNYYNSTFSQKINHYIKRLTHDPEPVFMNIGKTKLKVIKYKYQSYFELKKRKQFLEDKSIKVIEDKKFLLFPLHTEPESKILAQNPFYSNQITRQRERQLIRQPTHQQIHQQIHLQTLQPIHRLIRQQIHRQIPQNPIHLE